MGKRLPKGFIPSKVSRDIVLLEFRASYRRYLNGRILRYYLLQLWMGLALSLIVSFGLYVEVVYRLYNLKQLGPTPNYNKSYQKDPNHGLALRYGLGLHSCTNDKRTDDGASSLSPGIRPMDRLWIYTQ